MKPLKEIERLRADKFYLKELMERHDIDRGLVNIIYLQNEKIQELIDAYNQLIKQNEKRD